MIQEPSLCPATLRQALDDQVFVSSPSCPAYKELVAIQGITKFSRRIESYAQWCRSFESKQNVSGSGLQLLLDMMRDKQGACRHRMMIFTVLCLYNGVKARMVRSQVHGFCEVSPNQGKNWHKYDLGGGGNPTFHITPLEPSANIIPYSKISDKDWFYGVVQRCQDKIELGDMEGAAKHLVELCISDITLPPWELTTTKKLQNYILEIFSSKNATGAFITGMEVGAHVFPYSQDRWFSTNQWLLFLFWYFHIPSGQESCLPNLAQIFLDLIIQRKFLPVGLCAPFAEALMAKLEGEPRGAIDSALDNYYRDELVVPGRLIKPLAVDAAPLSSEPGFSGFAPSLVAAQERDSREHSWAYSGKGYLSFERLIKGLAPIKQSVLLISQRSLWIGIEICHDYCAQEIFKRIKDTSLPLEAKSFLEDHPGKENDLVELCRRSLVQWLLKRSQEGRWKWVVMTYFDVSCTFGQDDFKCTLTPGVYQVGEGSEEFEKILLQGQFKNYHTEFVLTEFSPNRLQNFIPKNDAICGKDSYQELYTEFLHSLDWFAIIDSLEPPC